MVLRAQHDPDRDEGSSGDEALLAEIRELRRLISGATSYGGGGGRNGNGNGNGAAQVWSVLSRIATVVLLPWLVWLTLAIMDMRSAISGHVGSEFSKAEAAVLEQRLRQERIEYVDNSIEALRREITAMIRNGPP